ncbi:MAG: outer membrane beta-barrel protein [Pseudomonadota bacterium]
MMKSALKMGLATVAVASTAAFVSTPVDAGGLFKRDGGSARSMDFGYSAPRAAAGPCYFRADIGASVSRDPSVEWPVNSITRTFDGTGPATPGNLTGYTTTYGGNQVSGESLDNAMFGDIGVGCGQGSKGFRAEAVFSVRGEKKFQGEPAEFQITDVYSGTPQAPTDFDDPMHFNLRSYTMMLNVYRDLGKWGSFVPYVGVGVGAAYHQIDEVYFTGNPSLTNRIEGNSDISFAWSLMAGFGYQITDRAVLDVGYRYIDMGKAKSGRADNAGFVNPAVKVDDIAAHEFKFGVRYHFGGATPVHHVPMK